MTTPEWDERYATGEIPWDQDEPCEYLMAFIASGSVPAGGRVIDIGCGTGTHALWLAEQGFEVVGCDIAGRAIDLAKEKDVKGRVRFERLDFLRDRLPEGPFDLAFDRGVFHVFDEAADRSRFAERVAGLLRPGGIWASVSGSTEGPPRDHGPPRRSARELIEAIEPWLSIEDLRRVMFVANIPSPAAAWWLVARRREIPAQPSTRRA